MFTPGRPLLGSVTDICHRINPEFEYKPGSTSVTTPSLANDRYVVTVYGRDYSDVPPLNGVIYTEGKTESLRVLVDVVAASS